MVNINFHQKNTQAESAQRKELAINGSFIIAILVLVVLFLTLFGLKMLNNNIENETVLVNNQINEEQRSLGEDKVNRVFDFQKRTEEVENGILSGKNPKEIMSKVESLMVPGVVLTSYNYDNINKSLKLEAVSDSFKVVAEQILSLKSSSYFDDVRVSKTARNEEGRINFSVESRMVFK